MLFYAESFIDFPRSPPVFLPFVNECQRVVDTQIVKTQTSIFSCFSSWKGTPQTHAMHHVPDFTHRTCICGRAHTDCTHQPGKVSIWRSKCVKLPLLSLGEGLDGTCDSDLGKRDSGSKPRDCRTNKLDLFVRLMTLRWAVQWGRINDWYSPQCVSRFHCFCFLNGVYSFTIIVGVLLWYLLFSSAWPLTHGIFDLHSGNKEDWKYNLKWLRYVLEFLFPLFIWSLHFFLALL